MKRMVQIINAYDATPEYINSYTQEMQARKRNTDLNKEFNTLMQKIALGYDGGVPTYLQPATEDKITEWLKSFEEPAWLKLHNAYLKAE